MSTPYGLGMHLILECIEVALGLACVEHEWVGGLDAEEEVL